MVAFSSAARSMSRALRSLGMSRSIILADGGLSGAREGGLSPSSAVESPLSLARPRACRGGGFTAFVMLRVAWCCSVCTLRSISISVRAVSTAVL